MSATLRSGKPAHPEPSPGARATPRPLAERGIGDLHARLGEALDRLSEAVLPARGSGPLLRKRDDATRKASEERIRFLGQVAAALPSVEPEALPAEGAGFGSVVEVEDVETGEREAYTLMVGSMIDIEAGQVSLASPIGRALLGCRAGDTATVELPQRRRSLRVVSVTTLHELLDRLALAREPRA